MTETIAFQTACELLEQLTIMTRAEARGTVRITLKEAGVDPCLATPAEISRTLETALPAVLRTCRIGDPERICARIVRDLGRVAETEQAPVATHGA